MHYRRLVAWATVVFSSIAISFAQIKHNTIGKAVDYLLNGSRTATVSDYVGAEKINQLLERYKDEQEAYDALINQIAEKGAVDIDTVSLMLFNPPGINVGDNYVKINAGKHEFNYFDDDQDGGVESFEWSENSSIKIDIHSQKYWNQKFAPRVHGLSETQHVMDSDLQKIIDDDYKMFRDTGRKTRGHTTRYHIKL